MYSQCLAQCLPHTKFSLIVTYCCYHGCDNSEDTTMCRFAYLFNKYLFCNHITLGTLLRTRVKEFG